MESIRYLEMSAAKYAQIRSRLKNAIEPLDEISLNWRPNGRSLSIVMLVISLTEALRERIANDFKGVPAAAFPLKASSAAWMSKEEVLSLIDESFDRMNDVLLHLSGTSPDPAGQGVVEAVHAEILHQCSALMSEQLGQVLYLSQLHADESAASIW